MYKNISLYEWQNIYKPIINNSFYSPKRRSFICAIHPARGKWKQTANEIYTFLDDNEINY